MSDVILGSPVSSKKIVAFFFVNSASEMYICGKRPSDLDIVVRIPSHMP